MLFPTVRRCCGKIYRLFLGRLTDHLWEDSQTFAGKYRRADRLVAGLTVLKDRVPEQCPPYLPPDPASRTPYEPGDLAQCDLTSCPVASVLR